MLPTQKGFFAILLSIVDIQYVIIGKKAQKRSQCALVGKIVRRENVNIVGFWEIRIAKKTIPLSSQGEKG